MLITEISENDFRKLDIQVYKYERVVLSENIPGHPVVQFQMVQKSLNDILDEQIEYILEEGYENGLQELSIPVTIAIHNPVSPEEIMEMEGDYPNLSKEKILDMCIHMNSYLDKYMNRYTGAQTFQIGWGIKHLYSTRDYYEDHEDYWRVKKKETEVIYRVHLNKREFELKHKTETLQEVSPNIKIVGNYDKINGEWVLRNKTKITKNKGSTIYEPISEDL